MSDQPATGAVGETVMNIGCTDCRCTRFNVGMRSSNGEIVLRCLACGATLITDAKVTEEKRQYALSQHIAMMQDRGKVN